MIGKAILEAVCAVVVWIGGVPCLPAPSEPMSGQVSGARPVVCGVRAEPVASLPVATASLSDVDASGSVILLVVVGVAVFFVAGLLAGQRISHLSSRRKIGTDRMRQALIFENIYDGVIVTDSAARIVAWNRGAERLFGYTREEILGKHPEILNRPEEAAQLTREIRDALRSFRRWSGEITFVRKDGTQGSCDAVVVPFVDEHGEQIGAVSVNRDVTERRRTQEELRKFKTICDQANYGTAISTLDGKLIYVNNAFAQMHGYAPDELIGESLLVFHSEEQSERVNALRERLRQEGSFSAEEVWHTRRDGTTFPTLMNAAVITDESGIPSLMSSTAIDVTEHKRMEDVLRRSEETARAIINASEDSLFLIDTEGTVLSVNKTAAKRFGTTEEELIGRPGFGFVAPDVGKRRRSLLGAVIRSKKPVHFEDQRDGLWFHASAYPVFNDEGEVDRLAICGRDITARKHAEEALRESELKFRTLFESAPIGIGVARPDGMITAFNAAAARMSGYSEADLGRFDMTGIYANPDERSAVLKTLEAEGAVHGREATFKRKDGTLFDASLTVVPFVLAGERCHMAAFEDITERKTAEKLARQRQAELMRVSRLSTMGELAAGLAHELNQPLAGIGNYAKFCTRELQEGEPSPASLLGPLQRISDQVERAASVIRHVRTLVCRREPHRVSIDVNNLIEEVAELIGHEARERAIPIHLDLASSLPLAKADPVEIEQVILNLLMNAFDALANVTQPAVTIRATVVDASGIEVTVTDNGPPTSDKTLDRVFEPFFTTKEEGMGMGLAICRTIAATHNGTLEALPNIGGGLTFRLTLPRAG